MLFKQRTSDFQITNGSRIKHSAWQSSGNMAECWRSTVRGKWNMLADATLVQLMHSVGSKENRSDIQFSITDVPSRQIPK